MLLDPQFKSIPAASFGMGSSSSEIEACVEQWAPQLLDKKYNAEVFRSWLLKEYPVHRVELKSFSIGTYPVTNQQYELYSTSTGARIPESMTIPGQDNHPVWGVSLQEARACAQWYGAKLGKSLRLPTEAEWEFAARGFARREYPYGNDFDPTKANSYESGIGSTTPVDRYQNCASEFGVVDLAGNVEEWVDTQYFVYPGGEVIEDDLLQTLGQEYPILRGGSFVRGGDLTRCARRHGPFASDLYRYTGFRLAY